jgi:preprotein translocase subunit YajC
MYLAATTSTSKGSGSITSILFIVVLVGAGYMLLIRPRSKQRRGQQQKQREITPGQRVTTTAGIYGTVTSVDDQDVELEIAPGVEIRIMRRAIMNILPEDSPTDDVPPEPEAETDFSDKPADDWDSKDHNP